MVFGLKTLVFATLLYQPTEDDFKRGLGFVVVSASRIERRIFLASASRRFPFWRIKCVRRNEQSELRLASLRAIAAFV